MVPSVIQIARDARRGGSVWVVVAFSAMSLVLNSITPSAGERAIWAPVALLLASSAAVAIDWHPRREMTEHW